MRKTNAEISTLLQKVVRDGKANELDKRLLSHAERLSAKYTMKHIMESARGVFTNDAWRTAFSSVRKDDCLHGDMGSFRIQKRFWRMARDEYNKYREDLPVHNANLTPVISRAYNDAYDVLLSQAGQGVGSLRPNYRWNIWVVTDGGADSWCVRSWNAVVGRKIYANQWAEIVLSKNTDRHRKDFKSGIDGQEIAAGDILLALTCPHTSEFADHTMFLRLPISWGMQVNNLGTTTIGNRIVKRAKHLGMFGDVEGYEVTLYGRGVRPTEFTEEDVYVGKLGDTIQICKSRMYIKSVTRRKVGSDVGSALLAAYD